MIRPNKRRFTIATYLLSGFLPWGRDFSQRGARPSMGRYTDERGGRWPLCCGHVMTDAEVAEWKAAGLIADGEPDQRGPRIVAGPNLESWVSEAWHGLKVASWAPRS